MKSGRGYYAILIIFIPYTVTEKTFSGQVYLKQLQRLEFSYSPSKFLLHNIAVAIDRLERSIIPVSPKCLGTYRVKLMP